MKQTVTCEVDIPDGWEFVRLGHAENGEHFISGESQDVYQWNANNASRDLRFIVRKPWQWPTWLKAKYVFMATDGSWWAANIVSQTSYGWSTSGACQMLGGDLIDFTPPECTDWRKSLRQNPEAPACP